MQETGNKEAMESITQRLSTLDNLYFPRALQSYASNPSQRQSLLLDLLSRDVAVFLERYGAQLSCEELEEFDKLKNDDYEVKWHLNDLRRKKSGSVEEVKARAVKVKNRRLAYLNKLINDGSYFSEDSMREREPYLHHEFVGKFQDLSARSMARPGEKWSETLMRRSHEAFLVSKIRDEQMRLGVDERDWVGNQMNLREEEEQAEEEEEEDEDENEATGKMLNATAVAAPSRVQSSEEATPSLEEKEDMMNQFIYIMHQKFLAGEDHQHLDYSKIDDDETLDDHWLREANDDAEDRYFGGDEDYYDDEVDRH